MEYQMEQETQVQPQQDTEMVEAGAAAEEQLPEQVLQEEPVELERFLSTGKLPDPENLPYKMYARLENGIVTGYQWEDTEYKGVLLVLMTFENSPAYVGGTYENGKFKEKSNG